MTPDSIREMNEGLLEMIKKEETKEIPLFPENREEEDTSFWPEKKRGRNAFEEDSHATEAISLG